MRTAPGVPAATLAAALVLCLALVSSGQTPQSRPTVTVSAVCDTCADGSYDEHTVSVNPRTGVTSVYLNYDYTTLCEESLSDVVCRAGGGMEPGIVAYQRVSTEDDSCGTNTASCFGHVNWPFILYRPPNHPSEMGGELVWVRGRFSITGDGFVSLGIAGGGGETICCECRRLPDEEGHECRAGNGWSWGEWVERSDPYEGPIQVSLLHAPVNLWMYLDVIAEAGASASGEGVERESRAIIDPLISAPETGLPVHVMRSLTDTTMVVVREGSLVLGDFAEATSGVLGDTASTRCAAWCDYDDDGDPDLYLANYGQANRLLRNDGSGTFTDVTNGSGPLGNPGNGTDAAWGDYDNDGDADLYVTNDGQANRLFRNEGDGTFTDATAVSGPVGDTGNSTDAAWGDYDSDGDLDLYVANYGQANRLFRNDGDGTFADVTGDSGPLGDTGNSNGVAWCDYDGDGDVDLYVVNYGQANRLFRNEGDGTFTDATSVSGPVGDTGNGTDAAWGDYDNDGDLDLYVANDGQANRLFRNGGNGTFTDVTDGSGPLGDPGNGTGAAWGDYDNDGDVDLYVTNDGQPNRLYQNDGDGTFTDATGESGPLGDPGSGTDASWGDYDSDGDLDLCLANDGEPNRLFRNVVGAANSWLRVEVEGTTSNRGGIGAKVCVVAHDARDVSRQVRELTDSGVAHFGLGAGTPVDSLIVTWPSGIRQLVPPPAPNTVVAAEESDQPLQALFTDVTHNPLGDSHGGGGSAWADYDEDGDLDLFVSNDQSGNRLFRSDGDGAFMDVATGSLASVQRNADGAWGDYDNDGDLDLFINTYDTKNRLLRNDGGDSFTDVTAVAGAVAETLGYGVWGIGAAWGDYDRDGDLDLCVSPHDLLRNDDGVFTRAVIDPELGTRAFMYPAWVDYDSDADLDLYLGGGGNRALYRNDGDGFTNVSGECQVGPPYHFSQDGQGAGAWGDYDNRR